jgi:hypothetical protein
MIRAAALAAVIVLAVAAPAVAYPTCLGGSGGVKFKLDLKFGEVTTQDQAQFDIMVARRNGIDAETAERTWLGCVKTTRRVNGKWVTEYYDPDTWQQVE